MTTCLTFNTKKQSYADLPKVKHSKNLGNNDIFSKVFVTKILEVWDGKTLSYFDELSRIKAKQMLVSGDVTKLVGEDLRMANEVADSAVGMTEDPIVDIGVLDVVR